MTTPAPPAMTPETEALVKRLRQHEVSIRLFNEAAALITSQAERIGVLEGALEPFAKLDWPRLADTAILEVRRFNVAPHEADAKTGMRVSYFRRAAQAISERGAK